MLKLFQCFMWFIIIPLILGMLPTHFIKKEKNNIFYNIVIGYVIQFAVLQLIAVPMIFAYCSLKTLVYIFSFIIAILLIISIIINRKDYKEFVKSNFENIKKLSLSTIIVVVLIGFQSFVFFYYTHIDDDDAFYVGTATTAVQTNTLYKYNGLTGKEYNALPSRYVLSPFPMYTAVISSIIFIHPTIVAHSILSVVFLLVAYSVYTIIANRLFDGDKKSINLFLIILSIVYMWGNYSIRSNFSFTLMRIWQGKAILVGIMLPLILILSYDCMQDEKSLVSWIILFITMIASCFLSEMALAIAPMALIIMAIVFSIKDKKLSYLIKSGICAIPSIAYLIIYLIIR